MTDYRYFSDGKVYEITPHGDRRLEPERERVTAERFKNVGMQPGIVTGSVLRFLDEDDPPEAAVFNVVDNTRYTEGRREGEHSRRQDDRVLASPAFPNVVDRIEIRPRDLVVKTSQEERDGAVLHRVRLEHKPTRLSVEAEAPTYEGARTKADFMLQDALQLTREEEEAFR